MSLEENKKEAEEMEVTEDTDESDDDTDDSSGDEVDVELQKRLSELQKQVNENPYMYDGHVELIKVLQKSGELEALRNARHRMKELFPLTEDLWLEWLQDEIKLHDAEDESARLELEALFDVAVKDYLSVPLWLEYAQYSIGVMWLPDGVQKVRDVFERGLTNCGLHVTKGANLWEAYREFENAIILAGLLPAPGCVATKELEDKFSAQHDRVMALFKRQLNIPLFDMEETLNEFKDWLQDDPDNYTKQTYNKAMIKLEKIKPFEDILLRAEPPRLAEYEAYTEYEEGGGDPARIQSLYERAVQENCLNPKIWLKYTKYLDHKLKVESVCLSVYERAMRNCPWCAQLWQNYLLLLEKSNAPFDKMKGVFETALQSGLTLGSEYLQLWTTFTDYLRRRIKWDGDHTEELKIFRLTMENAVQEMDVYGTDGDPNGTLRQFWALMEAKYCKNLEKARELWAEIMGAGRANEAALWMENYRFERAYGASKHCRRVLQRALNSVNDWPESIVDAYINFEREEGTFELYEQAVSRCEAQMARINERREKASESETSRPDHKKFGGKGGRKFDDKKQWGKHKQDQKQWKQREERPKSKANVSVKEEPKESDAFKVPMPVSKSPKSTPPPGFKDVKSEPLSGDESQGHRSEPPPGFKPSNDEDQKSVKRSAPPPGFKGEGDSSTNEGEPPSKKSKTDESSNENIVPRDLSKQFRTAFASNLSYDMDEEQLMEFFTKCGEVDEIRLIRNIKGRSKGFAYIQFKDELAVATALTHDRTPINGRPMYVAKAEDRSVKHAPAFRYSTELEKNKLFVKNLPFTMSKEALTVMFGAFGEIKDVRVVVTKSGKPKGLAFVEYVEEQDAAKAIMKADGILVGEHTIEVALSNPPGRKPPFVKREEPSYVPALGGGKKDTTTHGHARTQVMLMPRALKQKAQPKPTPAASSPDTQTATASDSEIKTEPPQTSSLSNSDFRSMLLKK